MSVDLREFRDQLWSATKYHPSAEQLVAHDDESRFKIIAGGIQAGKSYSAEKELLWHIFQYATLNSEDSGGGKRRYNNNQGLWWLVGPTYEMCRPEFQYLMTDLMELGFVKRKQVGFPKEGKCTIELPFGFVETKSGEEVLKLAGVAPDGILACEGAQLDFYAWLKLFERSATRRAWIWASGTFESSFGWYAEWWKKWQGENAQGGRSFSIPTWSNLAVYPGGRQDPEILLQEAVMPPDMFQERFGAIPCPPHGLVFREFSPTKHVVPMHMSEKYEEVFDDFGNLVEVKLPWDHEMELWVDPGAKTYAVLAIMRIGDKVYHYDEVYENNISARMMIDKVQSKTWYDKVKYVVMDVAGRQHHEGESHDEIWRALTQLPIVCKTVGIHAGIERHKSFLVSGVNAEPRLFHNKKCQKTIDEYFGYRFPDDKEGRAVRVYPIDTQNHCIVGDTWIDMPGGKVKIRDLVGAEPWVYCCVDGKVAVRKARNIRKTIENAPIVRVVMDRSELFCTPDHRIMLADGTYCEAQNLEYGQSVMALNRYISNDGYTRVALTGQTKRTLSEHRLVYQEVYGKIPRGYHIHHKDGRQWNQYPDNLIACSMEEHASIHLKEIKKRWWDSEAGKKRKAELQRGTDGKFGENHHVIAVLPAGYEDVYDMEVDEAHNFVANDVVIHNSMKAIAYGLVWHYGVIEYKRPTRLFESPFSDWTDRNRVQIPDWIPAELR